MVQVEAVIARDGMGVLKSPHNTDPVKLDRNRVDVLLTAGRIYEYDAKERTSQQLPMPFSVSPPPLQPTVGNGSR